MIFREAKIEDIKQIQIVRNAVKENTLSNPDLVSDKDCEVFMFERGKGWVCEVDNRIVGFSIADLKENNIWALFVHPDYDKQGIGRHLHDLMLKWYFTQTSKNVWLGTAPGTRAEIFYKKAGWTEVGIHGKGEIKFEMTSEKWKNITMHQTYIALLRGINVGGNKKVPMADLKAMMEGMGFTHVKTLLNSGNVVFAGPETQIKKLEAQLSNQLEKTFGFPVPVVVRKGEALHKMVASDPFKDVEAHKDIRLYVTYLKEPFDKNPLELPWVSPDGAFHIIGFTGSEVISYLDVSKTKTTDAMNILEKTYGKEITTRNRNTVLKISKLL